MVSKIIILIGVIVALASALGVVAVFNATGGMHQPATAVQAAVPTPIHGVTRTFYIEAQEIPWNYDPSGKNLITGDPDTVDTPPYMPSVYTISGKDRIGSTYLKCLYRGYTDDTFTTLTPRPDWLGIMGPVIHAEVGDTIKVVFKNTCRIPVSLHPHGVFYDKADEGASYNDGIPGYEKPGDSVAPNSTYTYTWGVPERAGPGPHDYSSVLWTYHSHVNAVADTYAGLIGPIIITRQGEANPDGTPKGVDKEFVTLYSIIDENVSPYIDYNILHFTKNPSSVNRDDPDFQESNKMASINGYVFGNLPGLVMKQGEHVRWYVVGMGTEVDLHVPHWHGNTLVDADGMRTDMTELLPMSMKVLDMYPDDVGTWLYHCHVDDHIISGMLALYTVEPNNSTETASTSNNATLGNLQVSLSTPPNPNKDAPTNLRIDFLDGKTGSLEQHVDYKVAIMKGNEEEYSTPVLHTTNGSVTMPYQFEDSGNYNIVVKVYGILFLPTSQTADFAVNVKNS